MAVSLKGVARRYLNASGSLSVRKDVLGLFAGSGPISLRFFLESLARQEHRFDMEECVYAWTAAFEQTWTHIRVRIALASLGIPDADMNEIRTRWQNGIRDVWSDLWGCGHPGESTCPLTFEVQWVNENAHHVVVVIPGSANGSGKTNTGLWHAEDGGDVAAHEFGHMLGHPDEYSKDICPDRSPVNTGTVMDVTAGLVIGGQHFVPSRLMTFFAFNIGSTVVSL